jgi:hypothetical protein
MMSTYYEAVRCVIFASLSDILFVGPYTFLSTLFSHILDIHYICSERNASWPTKLQVNKLNILFDLFNMM